MNVIGPKPQVPRVNDAAATRPATTPAAGSSTASGAAAAGPVAAPAGETTLWDLLTPEERDFFTQQNALGPLSYRPDGGTRGGTPPPTGRRIDVRG